jgi:heptosyltransferase-2
MMPEQILIVGLNWIGDAIMSMPAVQACRQENPVAHISMLVKPYLKPLWEMQAVPDEVLTIDSTEKTVRKLKRGNFDRALILPNSFRSAYLPLRAGINVRKGLQGKWRHLMLTETVPLSPGHQSNEYFPVLAPDSSGTIRALPHLNIPEAACHAIEQALPFSSPYITLMPGAARGASKMWPLEHFEKLAGLIMENRSEHIVFSGGSGDAEACEKLAAKFGERACSMAGKTSIPEWAALLGKSRLAVANDSGGMHLAAAAGTPVVGIYGITDPEKTGPLAEKYRVIQNSTLKARDIARNSEEAVEALASISPEQVFSAVGELLV